MSNWLEVRVPISPRPHYFNRIRFLAASIRALGGPYSEVRTRVTVGEDVEPYDLYRENPWSEALGVDWVWVPRQDFAQWRGTQHEYIATMMERFRPPFTSRYVLMLDADVLVIRPFDELVEAAERAQGPAAVMAHVSPFKNTTPGHQDAWRLLFAESGLHVPKFGFEHSGWGLKELDPERRFSPPYFNTGTLLAPASALNELYHPYLAALDRVRGFMDTYYFEQIALTLALFSEDMGFEVVPLRYNFPNQPEFDAAHPEELASVRFLHFLRTQVVDRERDFESLGSIRRLMARSDLTGSNEVLRARLQQVAPAAFSEAELSAAEAVA